MPVACCHQPFDDFDGLDSATGADGGAIERGGGAGEIELPLQMPALQEAVDEARVKNVSGAGGVDGLDAKSGGIVELRPVPGQYAFFAQRCSGKPAAKSFPKRGQGLAQIRFSHQPPRDIPAGNEIVDAIQEGVDDGIRFVRVGNDRNAGGASPARGGSRGGRIMSIDVKSAGSDDPIAVEFFRTQGQPVVPFPKNGALAGVIHENESLLAGTSRCGEEMRFDAQAPKFPPMNPSAAVLPALP